MDIHKPKPWRGLREFLKEYLIIVVGVLTALAGEQTVEWLHRRAEVREAREALRAEVAEDMTSALRNQRRQACDMTYLDRYVEWADGGPAPPPAGAPYLQLVSTNWDAVKSGPVVVMPLKEKLAYARFYGQVADYNTMIERERSVALRLAEHTGLRRLDAEEAKSVRKAVTNFRSTEQVLNAMANGTQQAGTALGVRANPIMPQRAAELDAFCRQASAPLPRR